MHFNTYFAVKYMSRQELSLLTCFFTLYHIIFIKERHVYIVLESITVFYVLPGLIIIHSAGDVDSGVPSSSRTPIVQRRRVAVGRGLVQGVYVPQQVEESLVYVAFVILNI